MSTTELAPNPTECATVTHEPLTNREAKLVAHLLTGMSEAQAFKAVGFPAFYHDHPSYFPAIDAIRSEVARLSAILVQKTLDLGLVNAVEIHEYLTDAIRAQLSDIMNDDFSYKPLSEWPVIWQRMYENGDVSVETEYQRSSDGKDGEKRGGWDPRSKVTITRVKFSPRVKFIELAMKHKGVNAMVQEKSGDLHLHIHESITAKLQSAIKRKEAIEEARNITPVNENPT